MWVFRWIFSKVGAVLAAALGILGLWAWGKHQQTKRQEAEAKLDVAETNLEVKEEEDRRHEEVEQATPDDLIDHWRK